MSGGENDFESLMEESLKAPRPGDVLVGRVLLITRDSVIIDINYKCEGQVPLAEFLDHEGHPSVKEGDEVDVYFEGTETDNGTVMLSHAKAEKFKVWRELDKAFQAETPVEGVVLGKVKGGLKVDIGVPAFLPGSHVDIRPARNLDRYVDTERLLRTPIRSPATFWIDFRTRSLNYWLRNNECVEKQPLQEESKWNAQTSAK